LSRKVKSPCVVYVMDSLHLSNSNMTIVKTHEDGQKTSVSDPDSIRSGDPESRSGKAKNSYKNKKKLRNFIF
jgi:hypothetical protein